MAYQSLYRTWRPMTFDEVVGQSHITNTLKNEVEAGKVGHAYLFCGSRGTGKTSTARILSRAVNCLNPKDGNPCNACENCKGILNGTILDITEIDAASNNGVDNIRDLREEARFTGTMLQSRIYIVDEVHMLSSSAFNALLKILEEPPQHVHFILATTEAHKVPATILSRCQRFDFKRINADDIKEQIKKVVQAEKRDIEDGGISIIAEKADGSMRDALSLLDQCIASGNDKITKHEVSMLLGVTDTEYLERLGKAVVETDTAEALKIVSQYVDAGKNITQLNEDFVKFLRDVLLCKYSETPEKSFGMSVNTAQSVQPISEKIDEKRLVYIIKELSETAANLRYTSDRRSSFEISLIKVINTESAAVEVPKTISVEVKKETVQKTEKPKEAAEQKEEHKEEDVKQTKSISKLKKEIIDKMFDKNLFFAAAALENSEIEDRTDKVVFVFKDQAILNSSKEMIKSEIDKIKDIINEISGKSFTLIDFEVAGDTKKTNDKLLKLKEIEL